MTRNKSFSIGLGSILLVLGILAVILPRFSTLAIELLIGWILIVAGVTSLFRAFRTFRGSTLFLTAVAAIIALIVGILMILHPAIGAMALTILVSLFFLLEGIASITMAVEIRHLPNWGWLLLNGLVALILCGLIWLGFPETAYFMIGLLVGINLIFAGLTHILLGVSGRNNHQ